MLYQSYQGVYNWMAPVRRYAHLADGVTASWFEPLSPTLQDRFVAYCEQISLMGFTHDRPAFRIADIVDTKGKVRQVKHERVHQTPFAGLHRFNQDGVTGQPKILLVAPMSGHFATLLTGTIQTLVRDHEVYLTDWFNARDIALECGKFGMDEYTSHIIEFLTWIGPGAHLMAVCQPTVAALSATAIMAQDKHPCQPVSLTLMAGPVDARINPTKVNELAIKKPIEWFKKNLIAIVPQHLTGAGRAVYPGFLQLTAFMSMNAKRHADSFKNLFELRSNGDHQKANVIREFYDEYLAIMDLSADFYLETVDKVFQRFELARGTLEYKGRLVNPTAMKRQFLLTVEGERDDICGIGQTLAAQDLCAGLPAWKKSHHLQAGVGHYGVFNGKKWDTQIYPIVRNMIQLAT